MGLLNACEFLCDHGSLQRFEDCNNSRDEELPLNFSDSDRHSDHIF